MTSIQGVRRPGPQRRSRLIKAPGTARSRARGAQAPIFVARAIVKRPDALLCDEPTGALDVETGKVVLAAIARSNVDVGAPPSSSHNTAIAGMAHRVLRLSGGRIIGIDTNAHRLSPEELSW